MESFAGIARSRSAKTGQPREKQIIWNAQPVEALAATIAAAAMSNLPGATTKRVAK